MAAEYFRQVIFGVLLIMMGVVVWATVWSNEAEERIRMGFMQPSPSAALLFADNDAPTTRP
jgi:hypothetical protein